MSRLRMPWHRSFGPIGLDLAADQPRALQVRIGPDAPFRAQVVRTAPGASFVERASAAAQQMRRGGFVGREVVVGVPSSFAKMSVVRIPVVAGNDGREAVAWEAAERCGLPREAIVADALPTGAPTNSQEGREEHLLVSAPVGDLTAALDAFIDWGFEPVAVEPRFAAVARALSRRARRAADTGEVRAVLHVEQHGSVMLVLRGDRVSFCREIPIGGDALDRAVAARLSVPIESAALLRAQRIALERRGGANPDSVTEEAALSATRATLDALAAEVALCLRYFGVTFRGGQPARIVLSGPQGAEPRLGSIIEEACRSTVVHCENEVPPSSTSADFARIGAAESGGIPDWLVSFGLSCRGRKLAANEEAA